MRARWPPVVLALPLALAVPVIDAAPARPEQAFACSMLRVETDWLGDGSRLSRVDLPGGEVTPIGVLDVRVSAIGYSREQELAYGVSGGHVVTFDRLGDLTVAGELPDAPGGGGPVRPTSAAVSGAGWYLLDDEVLYTVDIDPASPDYLRVTQAMPLVPGDLAGEFDDIDDIDFDPRTGLLYGVAADYPRSRVVRIDPGSGAASAVPGLALPPSTAYGAVALGPDGVLYATANVAGGRSRLYRAELDGTGKVTELSSGPVLRGSDATACLVIPGPDPAPPVPPPTTRPAPPTPEPPPPEPPPAPPPSPRPAPPPVPPREQPPPSPREPPQSPPLAAPEPAPPAPPPAAAPPPPPEEQAQSDDPTPTEKKRRWALTMLLIAFGAGAAARSMRRR